MAKKNADQIESELDLPIGGSAATYAVNYGGIVKWLATHIAEAPVVFTLTEAFLSADGLPAKWEATKKLGDAIVPIIDDFPAGAFSVTDGEVEPSEKLLAKEGYGEGRLEKLIPVLIQLLPVILKLLGK